MTVGHANDETPAATLCKACGLCCTGHLFIWTKLRAAELDSIQSLGLNVLREPNQRGFNQPCPLWDEICTIYETPNYPRFCHTYKCKLLKQVLDEVTPLQTALKVVQQTKSLIHDLDMALPNTAIRNFRERLVAYLEQNSIDSDLQQKAKELLDVFESQFGVNDLVDSQKPED